MKTPTKSLFDVKIELLIPTTITYRVTALNEQDALKEVDKSYAIKTRILQHNTRRIKLKATVYKGGTSLVKHTKTYRVIQ